MYQAENLCTRSKIHQRIRFSRQNSSISSKISRKLRKTFAEPKFFAEKFCRKNFSGVKKSKIANRLKRVLPKFRADWSSVWEVNGNLRIGKSTCWEKYSDAPLITYSPPAVNKLPFFVNGWRPKELFFVGVKKSKIANRLKRVLPKFRADWSSVWEVNGRSKKRLFITKNVFFCRTNFFGVKKLKIANRLKRVLPKFGADRSYVWEVNGRSKFVIAVRFRDLPVSAHF